jgi:AAA15 family ATPase/GTPase
MNLKSVKFCRSKDSKSEWSIEGKPQAGNTGQPLTFESINLIVGKNATGKSKTIDVLRHIADLFSGDTKLSQLNSLGLGTADYQLEFDNEGIKIEYELSFKDGKILQEDLKVDGQEKLNRSKSKLWYEVEEKYLESQTAEDVLAITKRDNKQHPFFEHLFTWGKNLSHYRFGQQLGKDHLLRDKSIIKDDYEVDLKDSDEVAGIFLKGTNESFADEFTNSIVRDMQCISYDIQDIELTQLKNIPIPVYGLSVRETDLNDVTDQREMSQGMFRALSLLIQLNYSLLSKMPSCILIDDIGEGLDFERSKELIDLIIKKVKDSSIQVIMTTNDRYVMNKIPLEYWSVIQRTSNKSIFYNYQNSKETFDQFDYTGLNNFDFLSTDFYIKGFETVTAT